MFIDTHAHIDAEAFDADREEVLSRAREAGVSAIVIAGAARTAEDMERTANAAQLADNLYTSCGVHPHEATYLDDELFAALEETSLRDRIVAIGESGLDYHYDHSPRETQRSAFERHIELAKRRQLPIICHIREAHSDALEILTAAGAIRGVIHCFTGGPDDAAAYLELGLYLSFSGIVTFGKNAAAIRAAAELTPPEKMLIETDAPYLAPVPMRGKRNEPAFIRHTAERLATVKGMQVAELAARTSANARELFDF